MKTGQALALMLAAAVFCLAGAGLLAWALYQYLLTVATPAAAAAVIGLLALLGGGALLWMSQKQIR